MIRSSLFKVNRLVSASSRLKSLETKPPEQDWESFEEHHKKYQIPVNNFQKVLLTCGSATMAFLNPYRADMVASLGETTGNFALQYMLSMMKNSEEGLQILNEKPRISTRTINLDELRNYPEDTLGKAYVNFLDRNKVTPDSRDPVKFIEDIELAYVMQRYREIHDFAHAVLGMSISILDELTIKWFEAVQNKLPMCFGGAIFGSMNLNSKERQQLLKFNMPWAIETGKSSKFLMNVYFERRLDQPLRELQKELNINLLKL